MLGERAVVLGWETSAGLVINSVACETTEQVDDIRLALSEGSHVLIQAKRSVTAQTTATSALGSAVDQFVRQHVADSARSDRLVLVCGPDSSTPIRRGLPPMLRRLRDAPPDAAHDLVGTNAAERTGWAALLALAERSWFAHAGSPPGRQALIELLSRVWVDALDVEDGGRDEQAALDRLANTILTDPADARRVWPVLVERMLGIAAGRRGIVRQRLQDLLVNEGFGLEVVRGMRADVAKLRAQTQTSLARLDRHSALRLGGQTVELTRAACGPLRAAALRGSLLVVGPPGIGKSGLLRDVADDLLNDNVDVVALRVEDVAATSVDGLRQELRLEHAITDVLAGWPGTKGVLIIDGLDAARGTDGSIPFLTLIDDLVMFDGRWSVVASVRTFDLRHNHRLRAAVAPLDVGEFLEPEFADVGHFAVPSLSAAELAQLDVAAPRLAALLAKATPQLRDLVSNPFNLSLLAELSTRIPDEQLQPITTQLQLLSRHWATFVEDPPEGRAAREAALTVFCDSARDHLALQIDRREIAFGAPNDAGIIALLRSGVLVEHTPLSALGDPRLSLSHNVLFDYAFARLALPAAPRALAESLSDAPDLLLLVRPSLELRLADLWAQEGDRASFWVTALLLGEEVQGILAQLVAPAIVAANVQHFDDLSPLLQALSERPDTASALRLLDEIVGAVVAAGPDLRPLSGYSPAAQAAWAQLAVWLAAQPDFADTRPATWLLWALWREADAQAAAR